MHYYPSDLAAALRQRWPAAALPDPATLTELLSIAYQGSLLQEEERPVVGHLLFAARAGFVPPAGGHLLRFSPARSFTEQELRRLSPTVRPASSLLVVEPAADGRLQIWALLFVPPASQYAPSPPAAEGGGPFTALVLHILGPGKLVFFCGDARVLTLHQGRIEGHGFVQFPVAWGRGRFAEALRGLRQQAQQEVGPMLPVPDELLIELSQQLQRRVIARVRGQGHGGCWCLFRRKTCLAAWGRRACCGPSTGSSFRPRNHLTAAWCWPSFAGSMSWVTSAGPVTKPRPTGRCGRWMRPWGSLPTRWPT